MPRDWPLSWIPPVDLRVDWFEYPHSDASPENIETIEEHNAPSRAEQTPKG